MISNGGWEHPGWRLGGSEFSGQWGNLYSISIWGRIDIDIEPLTYIDILLNIKYWAKLSYKIEARDKVESVHRHSDATTPSPPPSSYLFSLPYTSSTYFLLIIYTTTYNIPLLYLYN